MESFRVVSRPEVTPDGFIRRHICANGLRSDHREQFVRRYWRYYRFGVFPESLNPDLVPQVFRDALLSDTDADYVYHPRRWERAIFLGESRADDSGYHMC